MKTDNGGCPPESSCSVSSDTDQTALKTSSRGPSVPTSPLSHLNLTPTQRELGQTRLSRVIAPLWGNVTGPGDESRGVGGAGISGNTGGQPQALASTKCRRCSLLLTLLLLFSHSVTSDSWDPVDCSRQAPLSTDFPGKNTGVGCHFLLQGIFPTQGWNRHLLRWQADS